jgi:F-type H+-transporting ATPase subunit delta
VATSDSITSGIAARYASSLFELALESKSLDAVEKDLARFDALMRGSEDLMRLVRSPVFSTGDQVKAVGAVLDKAKIGGLTANFIRVVAKNRRLFTMPDMLAQFRRLAAAHRGEVSADVTVAAPLGAAHSTELKAALKGAVGKDVTVNEIVDPSILGGMIVKIGSRQIDTSLRTKLSSLKLALKEVG